MRHRERRSGALATDNESRPPNPLRALLAEPTSAHWTFVAPADGLHLVRVLY